MLFKYTWGEEQRIISRVMDLASEEIVKLDNVNQSYFSTNNGS